MNRVEEQRILKLAQAGNSNAFAQLYREHVQTIFRYLYYRLNDTHLAEDFTADVFTRAFKDLSHYQDMGKPFVAWLYRIAHARVVDYYRKMGRQGTESELDEAIITTQRTDDVVDNTLLRKQMAQALHIAIAKLIPSQQQVVMLRFIEEKSLDETALIMDKKVNAIKALQHRALKTLAQLLAKMGFAGDEFLGGLS